MHVEWDQDRCALSGLCTAIAPEVLDFTEDNRLKATADDIDSHRDVLQQAASACPTQAIVVVE